MRAAGKLSGVHEVKEALIIYMYNSERCGVVKFIVEINGRCCGNLGGLVICLFVISAGVYINQKGHDYQNDVDFLRVQIPLESPR